MKKTIFLSIIIIMTGLFSACSNSQQQKAMVSDPPQNPDDPKVFGTDSIAIREAMTINPLVQVGEENFTQIAKFVERYGETVSERGIPCDHQFTFIDKKGNRHAFITIKRDKFGISSRSGEINQITVWSYTKAIKDQEHFFGYIITEEGVTPTDYMSNSKYASEIKEGYNEFLALVNK